MLGVLYGGYVHAQTDTQTHRQMMSVNVLRHIHYARIQTILSSFTSYRCTMYNSLTFALCHKCFSLNMFRQRMKT